VLYATGRLGYTNINRLFLVSFSSVFIDIYNLDKVRHIMTRVRLSDVHADLMLTTRRLQEEILLLKLVAYDPVTVGCILVRMLPTCDNNTIGCSQPISAQQQHLETWMRSALTLHVASEKCEL
jgi:hypothetical protein